MLQFVDWATSKVMWSAEESSHWPLRLVLAAEVADKTGHYFDLGTVTAIPSAPGKLEELWTQSLAWTQAFSAAAGGVPGRAPSKAPAAAPAAPPTVQGEEGADDPVDLASDSLADEF